MNKIPDLVETAARYDLSDRATAVSSTTALFNHGVYTPVTRQKVRSYTRVRGEEIISQLAGRLITGEFV